MADALTRPPASLADPAVRLDRVCVVRQARPILDQIDWTIPAGACVALLGPNGSGKTTLTRVITGYEWPSAGTVAVLGQTLGRTDIRALRRRIAVVNPSERFGVDRALSTLNVALTGCVGTLGLYEQPTPQQTRSAAAMLDAVGLASHHDQPFGLLSTGEQRRCLLARALISRPELLILDEPTAGLDIAGRERLLATIDQFTAKADGPAILIVTHHVEEISPATQQVMLLNRGRVAAVGRPDQVITPEILSATMGCPVYVTRRHGRFWLEVLPEAWVELLGRT